MAWSIMAQAQDVTVLMACLEHHSDDGHQPLRTQALAECQQGQKQICDCKRAYCLHGTGICIQLGQLQIIQIHDLHGEICQQQRNLANSINATSDMIDKDSATTKVIFGSFFAFCVWKTIRQGGLILIKRTQLPGFRLPCLSKPSQSGLGAVLLVPALQHFCLPRKQAAHLMSCDGQPQVPASWVGRTLQQSAWGS